MNDYRFSNRSEDTDIIQRASYWHRLLEKSSSEHGQVIIILVTIIAVEAWGPYSNYYCNTIK